jgi:hypothetical protein
MLDRDRIEPSARCEKANHLFAPPHGTTISGEFDSWFALTIARKRHEEPANDSKRQALAACDSQPSRQSF